MIKKPKISIVTPSFNQGEFLEETILSVVNQTYDNWEYIIIDGGSTDNSIEIIKKYEEHLKFWVSEKDKGQANAINKGLLHCNGEIFNWLNSDDFLELNALELIARGFSEKTVDAVAGNVRIFSESHAQIEKNTKLSSSNLLLWKKGTSFVQPGVWLKKEKIVSCGGIDDNYHYSFDWDLYIRYLHYAPKVKEINIPLVNFRLHNQSKTVSHSIDFHKEELKIAKKLSTNNNFKKLKRACQSRIVSSEYIQLNESNLTLDSLLSRLANWIFWYLKYFPVSFRLYSLGFLKNIIFKKK